MFIKKQTFASLLLTPLFILPSCGEENINTSETPTEETTNGTDSNDKEDNEVTNGNEIVVDMSSDGGPDIAYWRGAQGPGVNGFFYNDDQKECLRIHAENGMKIYNGTRRLACDPKTEDFYIDENDKPATKQIDEYVNIKKYANEVGLQLICMMDGTPSWVIKTDKDFHWGDPDFKNEPIADHAPLPETGEPMEQYQNLLIKFAKESDESVAPDYHSIWIGTQEIAHTIGYTDGTSTIEHKKEAIDRYIEFWKPIADGIKANGGKVGGIQLNSSNANDGGQHNLYDYAVEKMKEENLILDYLTFQFYQWGEEMPMQRAAEAVRKYQEIMNLPDTRLIIDRGGSTKITDMTKSEAGQFILFLQGEKYCMNEADVVYAYTLDDGVGDFVRNKRYNEIKWQTKYWLMKCGDPESPNKRRELKNLPEGLDGFMTTKGNDLYGVIWNTGVSGMNKQKIRLQLTNTQATYTGTPTVYKASGNTLTEVKCKLSNNIISGVSLYSDEYLLIELKADNSGN